jgi:hypothetical protein
MTIDTTRTRPWATILLSERRWAWRVAYRAGRGGPSWPCWPGLRDAALPRRRESRKRFSICSRRLLAVAITWPSRREGQGQEEALPAAQQRRDAFRAEDFGSGVRKNEEMEDGNKLADKPAILEFLATWSKRHPAKKRQRSEECDCDSWFEYDAMLRSRSCEGSAGRWSACTTCAILEIQPFDDQVERDVAVRLASTYNARLS